MGTGHKKLVSDGCDADILYRLPRHVLDLIFECLPIRDVARMSILSRKWRYLWSAYPYLVFDQQFYDEFIANKPDTARMYANIIYKVLLLHDGPVLNFDLYIPRLIYPWGKAIDDWLLFLSRNGIQKLSLDYKCSTPYKLPSYVFSSRKLIKLKLINVIFKLPVGFSDFANLVELHLNKVTFSACELNEVSHVAPMLKKLYFISCIGIENFTIFAPQAVTLVVIDSTELTPIFFDNFPKLVIIGIGQQKGSSLNFYELHEKYPQLARLWYDSRYLKRFSATSTQKRLSFMSLYFVRVFHLSLDDLDQISCVLYLLKSSPKMKHFKASVARSKSTATDTVLSHLESPDCLGMMLSLQTVKLVLVEVSKLELAFIKCILAHSPYLQRLHIRCSFDDSYQQLRIYNELMRFPRASDKAKLIVLGP